MTIKEIKAVEEKLEIELHNAIIDSAWRIYMECQIINSSPEEPDFVAGLTLYFTPELFAILKKHFPSDQFSVTGVFCHQKPVVDIGRSKNPELGDLLIVYINKDRNNKKTYNALLLQAKVTSDENTTIAAADRHQLELYLHWPEFTYTRARSLNGISRDIQPKTIHNGSQYLLIDDDPLLGLSGAPGTFPMGCATANPVLTLNNSLAKELVELFKFKSGRTFDPAPGSKDDWTNMIWDLLAITKGVDSKRINAGINILPRQTRNQDLCFFMASGDSVFNDFHSTFKDGNNNYNGDSNEKKIDEIGGGISLILIEGGAEGGG